MSGSGWEGSMPGLRGERGADIIVSAELDGDRVASF
jgi:hypothetical protein